MAAAQWFILAAKNHTEYNFKPGQPTMTHGDVYDAVTIKAGTTTTKVFKSRGDNDAAAGTEGTLVFVAEEDESVKLTLKWDIPWGAGKDKLSADAVGDIKLDKVSFSGDEVLRTTVELVIKPDMPLL